MKVEPGDAAQRTSVMEIWINPEIEEDGMNSENAIV